MKDILEAFNNLFEMIKRLRKENAWDKEQTPKTMLSHLLEETYEAIDAIEECNENASHVKEELGDILLIILMISYMYEESGKFSFAEVIDSLSKKLTIRLPHIFTNEKQLSAKEVLSQWNNIKEETRKNNLQKKESILDGIPKLPPLLKAVSLKNKVAKIGFDWDDVQGVMEKLDEEVQEVKDGIAKNDIVNIEEEIGDVLFVLVNMAEKLNINAELALNNANKKFEKRFRYVEERMKEEHIPLKKENVHKMEEFWQEIKAKEHLKN
ncbi:MAG: nucleoside triphosphate pyrophosphohydrolase [Treponema sp.]